MTDQAGKMADSAREKGGRVADTAREHGGRLQERSKEALQKGKQHAPTATQALGILAALAVAGTIITVTVIGFIIASPFLLFFSPILVPLGALLLFGTGVFAAFVSAVSWVYSYMKGKHPPGADKLDQAKRRLADTAHHLTEKASDMSR